MGSLEEGSFSFVLQVHAAARNILFCCTGAFVIRETCNFSWGEGPSQPLTDRQTDRLIKNALPPAAAKQHCLLAKEQIQL